MSRTRIYGSSENEDAEVNALFDKPKLMFAPTLSNVFEQIKSQSALNLLPSTSKAASATNEQFVEKLTINGKQVEIRPSKMAAVNTSLEKQKPNKRTATNGNGFGNVNEIDLCHSQIANMDVGPLSMPSTEPTSVPNLKITSKCDGEINDSQYNMKPAPLYLYEVTDIKALSAELNSVVGENNFTTMPAAKCVIRVQCNDIASYNKLDKYVMEKKLDRHTFQYGFRAFIRHLHHSTPEKWIREKLTNLGHDIIFLRVIKNRYNNQPLNLFEVVLQMKDNNAELFKLGSLGSQIIKVEVPLKVPEVPQCHRCQRLGHTKNYCNRPFVCVKCGENHATTACTRQKNDESPAKCANCLGPHAASYKGCPVYKAAKTNANSAKLNKLITGLTNATPATPATVGRRKPVNKKSTTQPTFKEPLPLAARPQQQQQQRSRSLSIRRTPSWPTLTHSSATNYNNNTQLDQTTLESKLDILIEMASTLVQMLVAARLPIPEAQ